jgi:tannase
MRYEPLYLLAAAGTTVHAASLDDVCTMDFVASVLPADGFITGTSIVTGSVAVTAISNVSVAASAGSLGVDAVGVCNITFGYTHDGKDGTTNVWYYFPEPSAFQNRFLATGGGGLSGGLPYGAAMGTTDAGLGSWSAQLTDTVLYANGSMNYDALYAFSHVAIHEMTVLGQQLAKTFYSADKIYSYYQEYSEGGRDGFS